ncbi:hypothetical protein QTP88_024645 [Uroleucon formosanum]
MSTNRKRLSGDKYKKIAKLKSEKLHDVISKTHKLTDFFKNPASTSGSCSSNSNTNTIDILKKTDAQVSETTISLSVEVDNIEPEGSCGSNELTNMIVNGTIFETDLVKGRLINGEIIIRSWLVYSPSLGVVFCGPCRIFQTSLETQLVTEGFNDWKNAISRFSYHENSKEHRNAIINLKHRGNVLGSIDYSLIKQLDTEIEYWRNVLKRVAKLLNR